MKTILVTGGRGMLAHDLIPRLGNQFRVIPVDLPELDITDPAAVRGTVGELHPDGIINCAAYTAVDKAESEAELAFKVNRDGAGVLAGACSAVGIPLIHISTDFIFDGSSTRPYREDDPAGPLSVYGRSKWEGEEAVRSQLDRHVIVRTAWLFGSTGNNFVKTVIRLAREREELRMIDDQTGCPTWTGHLADALVTVAENALTSDAGDVWGTYHFCGAGQTTWYGFTRKIIELASPHETFRVKRLLPIPTSEYPTPATRPPWSVLDTSKISRTFGVSSPAWQEGLAGVIEDLYHEKAVG